MTYQEKVWGTWLMRVMSNEPRNNPHIQSDRGQELLTVALEEEKRAFNWRRSDVDTFWIDLQLAIIYGLDDSEFRFLCRMQAGVDNHEKHAQERNAYAEMKRGLEKLKKLNFPEVFSPLNSEDEQKRLFNEKMMSDVIEKVETGMCGKPIPWNR